MPPCLWDLPSMPSVTPVRGLAVEAARKLGHAHINAVPQMSKGRLVPDYGLFRRSDHFGWAELKAPDKDLDALSDHDARQHARMLEDLEAFVLTNGWDWRFFVEGRLDRRAEIPRSALTNSAETIPLSRLTSFSDLLDALFSRAPSLADGTARGQVRGFGNERYLSGVRGAAAGACGQRGCAGSRSDRASPACLSLRARA